MALGMSETPPADPVEPARFPRGTVVAAMLGVVLAAFPSACRAPGSIESEPPRFESIGGTLDCRARPKFAAKAGFTAGSALSTGSEELPGLVLVDARDPGHTFQHASWLSHGSLGPLTYDAEGNVYVAPTPNMDLLENPPEAQNTIYKVDTHSGEMDEFVRLAPAGPLSAENPFGILGLTYDCETRSLYASSVAGSSRRSELGRILRIDPLQARETDALLDVDAMGLAVFRGSRDRRLYFGSARRPELWSVALDERGGFFGPARREFVLPGWTDKARRIVFDGEGGMEVFGVPFVFNLTVGADAPENVYGFSYEPATDAWALEGTP